MKSKFFVAVTLLSVSLLAPLVNVPLAQADVVSKTMCLDLDQQRLKDSISAIVKDAQTRQLLPALAYEGYNLDSPKLTVSLRANLKAEEESKRLSAALFAAIAQSETPAQAASGVVTGNPFKRSSYSLKDRCPVQRGQPQSLAQCLGDPNDPMSMAVRDPIDMGLNISQVYETETDSQTVIQNFMKVKLTSTESNTVSICSGWLEACRAPKGYSTATAVSVVSKLIEIGHEYYVQDTTTLARKLGIPIQMTNRSALKVSEIKGVCGGSVYIVSAFNSGSESGFDRATLLTLVAGVGSKTLVVGDFSAQAMDHATGGGDGWPLKFPGDEVAVNETVIKGYNGIAQLIGSTDRLESYRTIGGARVPASQPFRAGVAH